MEPSSQPDSVIAVRVDGDGLVRLDWARGTRITEQLAREAMSLVDEVCAGRGLPLLVDMAQTDTLTRGARLVFSQKCAVSAIALLGVSPVDKVIANFALGVSAVPVPTRFFTSETAAVGWLRDGAAR